MSSFASDEGNANQDTVRYHFYIYWPNVFPGTSSRDFVSWRCPSCLNFSTEWSVPTSPAHSAPLALQPLQLGTCSMMPWKMLLKVTSMLLALPCGSSVPAAGPPLFSCSPLLASVATSWALATLLLFSPCLLGTSPAHPLSVDCLGPQSLIFSVYVYFLSKCFQTEALSIFHTIITATFLSLLWIAPLSSRLVHPATHLTFLLGFHRHLNSLVQN